MKVEWPLTLADDEMIIHLSPLDRRGTLFLATTRRSLTLWAGHLPRLRTILFYDKAERWLDKHAVMRTA